MRKLSGVLPVMAYQVSILLECGLAQVFAIDGSNLSTSCTVTLLPVGVKGDVNGDSNISISDVTKLNDYLLSDNCD